MRKVSHIHSGTIGLLESGDRLHFKAEEDHRSDWEGPREFDVTVRSWSTNSRFGPRIQTVEKIGSDLDDDFYLDDEWTITVIHEEVQS